MARDWQVQGLLPGAGGSLPAPFDGAQHGPHFVVALPSGALQHCLFSASIKAEKSHLQAVSRVVLPSLRWGSLRGKPRRRQWSVS